MTEHAILALARSVLTGTAAPAVYCSCGSPGITTRTGTAQLAKLDGIVIVSAMIGDGLALSGLEGTPENMIAGMTANLAILALLNPVLKELFRRVGAFPNYSG